MNLSKLPQAAQVAYLNLLKDKATNIARDLVKDDDLLIDLQGRTLIDVSVTKAELQALNFVGVDDAVLDELAAKETTVSLDISNLDVATTQLSEQLTAALSDPVRDPDDSKDILAAYIKTPKGSIIALEQELHFHLSLVSRTYLKTVPELKGKDEAVKEAFEKTMYRLNEPLMKLYAEALRAAYTDAGEIDLSILNERLDKARKQITLEAHKILHNEISTHEATKDVHLTKKSIKGAKHIAESTTATGNDLLHTDISSGLVTWIEGSEVTSHDRDLGITYLAPRSVVTQSINKEGDIEPKAHARMQVRIPSLDAKNKKAKDPEHIKDVKNKIAHLAQQYMQDAAPVTASPPIKAFVYNLLTSIEHTSDDLMGKNKQTQGARQILVGAHQYNKEAVKNGTPLCLVQNIPVNGFGGQLSYEKEGLLKEAALMADMALMQTLCPNLNPPEQTLVKSALDKYLEFLNTDLSKNQFFSSTAQGHDAWNAISAVKAAVLAQNYKAAPPADDILANATVCLRNIVAGNYHLKSEHHEKHEFGKLTQALSVFLEPCSMGGCKSANERAQAINSRVSVFDSLLATPADQLTEDQKSLIKALSDFAQNNTIENLRELKKTLNTAFNNSGLQSAISLISLVDQGAAAKGMVKTGPTLNGNYFEDSGLTNLHQSKSDTMQAHKGLVEYMQIACTKPLEKKPVDEQLQRKLEQQVSKYSMALGRLKENEFLKLQELLKDADGFDEIKGATKDNYEYLNLTEVQVEQINLILNGEITSITEDTAEKKILTKILNNLVADAPKDNALFVQARLPRSSAQDDLYEGIEAYKSKHLKEIREYASKHGGGVIDADSPDYFRRKFIEYCLTRNFDSFEIPKDGDPRKDNPKDATRSLEALFGEEGAELYKLALKEERFSKEYMDAVLYSSTTFYAGEKWAERPVVIVAGPSASGKSFAAQAAVQAADGFLAKHPQPDKDKQPGNYVVAVDGGVAREVSQMRKLAIRIANEHGFTGIADLHAQSEELGDVKKCVQNAVFQTSDLGVVIPETFSSPLKASKLYDKVSKLENAKVVFSRVDGADPETFREVVSFMGSRRAWKTDKFGEKLELDLNSVKSLCESKGYGKKGFFWGREGSLHAENYFKKHNPDILTLLITNDLILLKPNKAPASSRKAQWLPASENDEGVIKVSKATYQAWLKKTDAESADLEKFIKTNSKTLIATTAEQGIQKAEKLIKAALSKNKNAEVHTMLVDALRAISPKSGPLNNPTSIEKALEKIETLQKSRAYLELASSDTQKAIDKLHKKLEARFHEVAIVEAVKQYKTLAEMRDEQEEVWIELHEEQSTALKELNAARNLRAPLLRSFEKLDAMSIPQLNEAFLSMNKKSADALKAPLEEMGKQCTAIIALYEEQQSQLKALLEALPKPAELRGKSYKSEVEAHREELTKALKEIETKLDKVLLPAQKRIEGDKHSKKAIEREGLLESISAAQKDDKEVQLASTFRLTHKDVDLEEHDLDIHDELIASVSLTSNKAAFNMVDKLPPDKQRVYQVTSAEHSIGTFVEQHLDPARKTTETSTPQVKFIATKPPAGRLDNELAVNKKVIYAFALASQLLGKLDSPPSKDNQITLEGSSKEDLQFLYVALLLLGKNNKMPFGPEALRVRSISYDPSKESISRFSGDSCYGKYFKDNAVAKQILTDFDTLLKAKSTHKKEQTTLVRDLNDITSKFKKRLDAMSGPEPDSTSLTV